MKVNANWCAKMMVSAMVFALVFMALSCGGGGTNNVGLDTTPTFTGNTGTSDDSGGVRGTGVIVTENDIASLPRWQQELLSDPGWNQPYIEPPVETEIEGPSYEMLMELTRQKLEAGMSLSPRGSTQGKSASWDELGDTAAVLVKGEYNESPANMTPDFGCNTIGNNEGADGHAIEDLIGQIPMPINPVNYVREGISSPNYFNETGGAGNDMLSAVYQLFAEDPGAPMEDPNFTWAELSYNAGLLGAGIAPLGDCSAATAIPVEGAIWRAFNRLTDAQPGLNTVAIYNMLIAPAGPESPDMLSSGDSTFSYQPFYFGTVGNCFGGAWIVSISGSTSACDTFADFFTDDPLGAQEFFTNPVYGVLLKRWQEMSAAGTPWEAGFGLPVFGPFAYANGAPVLTGKGQYYAWGMWFEKGFEWWIDYDNEGGTAPYPNATDEAQSYVYAGDNVYCDTGLTAAESYIKQPTVFYGGQGDLGVAVGIQSQRYMPADPWEPVAFLGDRYEVELEMPDGLSQVSLSMFAQGFGGTPDADCNYKHYIWALRNGSIVIPGGADFDPGKRFLTGTYGSPVSNQESIYVVRVQVTDANDDIAYGDSFPIHLGHTEGGTGGGFSTVTVVNNDMDGDWPTGLTAIEEDLQELIDDEGLEFDWSTYGYDDNVAADAVAANVKMVIWYRGGPTGASGEPINDIQYTDAECDNLDELRAGGIPVINFTQSMVAYGPNNWQGANHGLNGYWCLHLQNFIDSTIPSGWNDVDFARNLQGIYEMDFAVGSWSHSGPVAGANVPGGNYSYGGYFANHVLGEGYLGPGSCGARYGSFGYQLLNNNAGQSRHCLNRNSTLPFGFPGATRGLEDYGYCLLSYGNTVNKQFTVGYNWGDFNVTFGSPFTPTRAQCLQNIMASLDSDIWSYSSGGGGGNGGGGAFSPYVGDDPDIVMVKPVFWNDDGTYIEGAAGSALTYPDPTSTDILRSTAGPYNDEIMRTSTQVTDPAPGTEDGLNGNDIDLQAPFYGYWHFGPDGTTGYISGNEADEADDIMWAGGVLVDNPDTNFDTFGDYVLQTGDPGLFGTPAGDRQVSGFYINDSASDPTLDGHVSANYGVNVPSISFDGRIGVMSWEAIARWAPTGSLPNGLEAHSGNPARLRWCLFPGHGVVIPAAPFDEYGKTTTWKGFLGDHQVANGDTGPYRDSPGFLRPAFTLGGNDSLTDGRIIDFDMRDVKGWYTDFNGNFVHADLPNGVDDPGDKYPARARLITHWTAYYSNNAEALFPNTLPDPATFVEVGAYVVDLSAGDPGVEIVDDPDEPDPGFEGTFRNENSPTYEVDLYFEIVGGSPGSYDVFLDPAYDLDTYDPLSPLATFGDVNGEEPVGNWPTPGLKSATVSYVDNDGGERYFALRVDDGTNQGFMFYPEIVNVGPPMRVLLLDDPLSANSAAFDNLEADIIELYGSTVLYTHDLSTDLATNDLDGYDGVLWASDFAFTPGYYFNNRSLPAGYSYGSGQANLVEMARYVNDGGTLFLANPSANRIDYNNYYTPNGLDLLIPMYGTFYSTSYSGYGAQYHFYGGIESVPNELIGLDEYSGNIGPDWNSCYTTYTPRAPGVRCVRGYYPYSDSYHTGAYRTGIGSGQGKIFQFQANYGDFADTQSDGASRAECFQNMMCMAGNNMVPWDPDYIVPEPTTVLYRDDLDGNTVGSASFYEGNLGGTWPVTYTEFDAPSNSTPYGTFGSSEANVGGNAYFHLMPPVTAAGMWHTGFYNNKVVYWGPMDFTAETLDPIFWCRGMIYNPNGGAAGSNYDQCYAGWDQDSNDPPTLQGRTIHGVVPSLWNYGKLRTNTGTLSAPAVIATELVGAAGQDNVWVTFLTTSNNTAYITPVYYGSAFDNFVVGTYGLPPTDM